MNLCQLREHKLRIAYITWHVDNITWEYNVSVSGNLLHIMVEVYQNILKIRLKLFWKTKRGLELVSRPVLLHVFLRKIFLMLYYINWPNFVVWLPLLLEILGNMCIGIICCTACDDINFKINHSFLIKRCF